MKKRKLLITLVLTFLVGSTIVQASSGESFVKVASEQEFNECISTNNMCELTSDLTLDMRKAISSKVIIDLNGHTIAPTDGASIHAGLIRVNHGGKLTVMDSKGNGKITTGNNKEVWAAIDLTDSNKQEDVAELIVNSGTIEGFYYGITGNGDINNTKITINGGNIKTINSDDSVAVFQPQKGTLEINNGTITGGTGVEIRSGDLTVNGGTIIGNASKFEKMVNGNGTTTNGVGITVAQHTTKNPINVVINNGTISGIYGLYEWNPHNNSEIDKVKMVIHNGDFKTTTSDGAAVYSADFTNFIKGGKYNSDIDKYKTADAKTTSGIAVKGTELQTTKKENKILVIVSTTLFIIIVGISCLYVYKNKEMLKRKFF